MTNWARCGKIGEVRVWIAQKEMVNYLEERMKKCEWIRFGDGNPEGWRETADKWLELGATHLTFYTSGQGVGALDKQIEAMERFQKTVG